MANLRGGGYPSCLRGAHGRVTINLSYTIEARFIMRS